MKNKTIEMLVREGRMDCDETASYYEDREDYINAIRHHSHRESFNLALEKRYYGLAKRVIKSMEKTLEREREDLAKEKKEARNTDYSEIGGGLGAAMSIGSSMECVESLAQQIRKYKKRLAKTMGSKK